MMLTKTRDRPTGNYDGEGGENAATWRFWRFRRCGSHQITGEAALGSEVFGFITCHVFRSRFLVNHLIKQRIQPFANH